MATDLTTGEQYLVRGGPGGPDSTGDAFGSILTVTRPWGEDIPGAPDNPSKTIDMQPVGGISGSYQNTQDTFDNIRDGINAVQTPYYGLYQNSNSVTYTTLTNMGLTPPTPLHSVPGWGTTIPVAGAGPAR